MLFYSVILLVFLNTNLLAATTSEEGDTVKQQVKPSSQIVPASNDMALGIVDSQPLSQTLDETQSDTTSNVVRTISISDNGNDKKG